MSLSEAEKVERRVATGLEGREPRCDVGGGEVYWTLNTPTTHHDPRHHLIDIVSSREGSAESSEWPAEEREPRRDVPDGDEVYWTLNTPTPHHHPRHLHIVIVNSREG